MLCLKSHSLKILYLSLKARASGCLFCVLCVLVYNLYTGFGGKKWHLLLDALVVYQVPSTVLGVFTVERNFKLNRLHSQSWSFPTGALGPGPGLWVYRNLKWRRKKSRGVNYKVKVRQAALSRSQMQRQQGRTMHSTFFHVFFHMHSSALLKYLFIISWSKLRTTADDPAPDPESTQ